MGELNVLAVRTSGQDLVSAQVTVEDGQTTLACGRSYPEAVEFLHRHPGAILLCKDRQELASTACLSALVRDGHPSAIVWICPTDQQLEVDLRLLGDPEPLRRLADGSEVLRKVLLACEFCLCVAISEPCDQVTLM